MRGRFGCIKDRFDKRDYLMRAYLAAVKLPASVDWSVKMSPVRDQQDEGTCVGFATACGMKEHQELLDYRKPVVLSPRFIYAQAKLIDGVPGEEGTTIRAAMKALKDKGVCREEFWPYLSRQKTRPMKGAVSDARKFRILAYARILDLNELRLSIFSKGPCVIGVEVFEGMLKTKTGFVSMPKKGERTLGGHAICAAGYDDKKRFVKFKNSWSDKWGEKGYGFLSYAYIERYMMDAWSSVDIDDPNPLTLASVLRYKERALS